MKLYLLLALVVAASADMKTYHGHKVLRTDTLTPETAKFLQNLQVTTLFDFWKDPRIGEPANIMASPADLKDLEKILKDQGINFSYMVEDVEQLIQKHKPAPRKPKAEWANPKYEMDWNDFHDIDVINAFIESIAADNSWADITTIGQTGEGRDMKVLSIRKAGDGKPNIWLEAGIHAREWISPAVATYMIKELVENYSAHPEYLDELNWYLLPSVNPDGYAYTWSDDRLWRKNRSPQANGCYGTDINRNFGFHWHEAGVSDNPCSEVFPGLSADSEMETQNIEAYVQTLSPVPIFANCFHSFSQLWLVPYGYGINTHAPDYEEMMQLAVDSCNALEAVHGTHFTPESSGDLYPAAGAADDWYKGVLGSKYVYTTELRDEGQYGFVLPKEQIIPSCEEMWAAFDLIAQRMIAETSQQ